MTQPLPPNVQAVIDCIKANLTAAEWQEFRTRLSHQVAALLAVKEAKSEVATDTASVAVKVAKIGGYGREV